MIVGLHVLVRHPRLSGEFTIVTPDGRVSVHELRREIGEKLAAAKDLISSDVYELYREWERAWGVGG
jgi:hypothetical protein